MSERGPKRSRFGVAGLVLGCVALGAALAHFWLGPLEPPKPLEHSVAETAVKIKKAMESKLRGELLPTEQTPRQFDNDQIATAGTIGAAFFSIVLAVISFVRREDLRVSGSAAALGAGAIAFEFAALALGVIVVVILIAAILNAIGISP